MNQSQKHEILYGVILLFVNDILKEANKSPNSNRSQILVNIAMYLQNNFDLNVIAEFPKDEASIKKLYNSDHTLVMHAVVSLVELANRNPKSKRSKRIMNLASFLTNALRDRFDD